MKPLSALAACLLAVTFAGCANTSCTNNSGGQECEGTGNLTYNGAANGGHDATVKCDTTAHFQASANVGGGQVVFTIMDGTGAQKYSKTAGQGQTTDNKDLEGSSGTWTMHAERTGGLPLQSFSGQYEATITC